MWKPGLTEVRIRAGSIFTNLMASSMRSQSAQIMTIRIWTRTVPCIIQPSRSFRGETAGRMGSDHTNLYVKLIPIWLTPIFLLCSANNVFGQVTKPQIFTEHPPTTKGVFANLSYPAGPILGNSTTGDARKFFKLTNGIFRPKFGADGYIVRTGAYLKSVLF